LFLNLFVPKRYKVYAICSFLSLYQLTVPEERKLVFGFSWRYPKFFCNFFLFCPAPGNNEFINGFLQVRKAVSSFKPGFFPEDFFGAHCPGVACLDFVVTLYIAILTKNLAFVFYTVFSCQFAPAGRTSGRTGSFFCRLLSLRSFKRPFHPEF